MEFLLLIGCWRVAADGPEKAQCGARPPSYHRARRYQRPPRRNVAADRDPHSRSRTGTGSQPRLSTAPHHRRRRQCRQHRSRPSPKLKTSECGITARRCQQLPNSLPDTAAEPPWPSRPRWRSRRTNQFPKRSRPQSPSLRSRRPRRARATAGRCTARRYIAAGVGQAGFWRLRKALRHPMGGLGRRHRAGARRHLPGALLDRGGTVRSRLAHHLRCDPRARSGRPGRTCAAARDHLRPRQDPDRRSHPEHPDRGRHHLRLCRRLGRARAL